MSSGKGPRKSCSFEDKLPDFTISLTVDPGEGVTSELGLVTCFNSNFAHDMRLAIYQVRPCTLLHPVCPQGTDPSEGARVRRKWNFTACVLACGHSAHTPSSGRSSSTALVWVGAPTLTFLLMMPEGRVPRGDSSSSQEGSQLRTGENSSQMRG